MLGLFGPIGDMVRLRTGATTQDRAVGYRSQE